MPMGRIWAKCLWAKFLMGKIGADRFADLRDFDPTRGGRSDGSGQASTGSFEFLLACPH